MRVALVDYGAGNLASVSKGLRASGADVVIATAPAALGACQALVIPGVGHFAATRTLDAEWRSAILACMDAGAALLGICLGMQWLYDGSAESPELTGLGVFAGTCQRIAGAGVKVPHVGWNTLDVPGSKDPGLLQEYPGRLQEYPGRLQEYPGRLQEYPGRLQEYPSHSCRSPGSLDPGSLPYAYFTHSYAPPVTGDTVATTTHGLTFASTVARGRVWGAQWHPEKSGETGLGFLRGFLQLAGEVR